MEGAPREATSKNELAEFSERGYDGLDDDDDDNYGQGKLTKIERLIEWNVDILSSLIIQILAARDTRPSAVKHIENQLAKGDTVLEEFKEIITLPKVGLQDIQKRKHPSSIQLDSKVVAQLRDYIIQVAGMYRENAFHNFEHASHVTMSVSKLLGRIVAEKVTDGGRHSQGTHDGTYGIASDPLAQFAVILSALVHDVDHRGVPNFQLIRENKQLADKYKNKSVAEANSTDLAWDQLMVPKFKELRECLYSNTTELLRFRALIVNTVLATDIFDKELGLLRRNRWDKAFSIDDSQCTLDDVNRRGTIVMEHLIQASDVAHTMQHYQIFKKWNERLFCEMYEAYKQGRSEKNPIDGWYQSEIGFFDHYVIPLAKKLKDCGVFGVSSDEYLNYALENRREWSNRGEEVVEQMRLKYVLDDSEVEGEGES